MHTPTLFWVKSWLTVIGHLGLIDIPYTSAYPIYQYLQDSQGFELELVRTHGGMLLRLSRMTPEHPYQCTSGFGKCL